MDFLPDVWTTCAACGGRRFTREVLECALDGRTIAGVLDLSVDEALRFLAAWPDAAGLLPGLRALGDVGLGYLPLGQATRTLSGGERQRLALARALLTPVERSLFLFDEPTTGLHAADVERLLGVFRRLVEAGHTVVTIEHELQLVAAADWVVDLGPEGGRGGGRVVVAGPPEAVAAASVSHTGRALRRVLGG
jgi:excinuclease ABC subunit A